MAVRGIDATPQWEFTTRNLMAVHVTLKEVREVALALAYLSLPPRQSYQLLLGKKPTPNSQVRFKPA